MLLLNLIIFLMFGTSMCSPPRTCCVLNVEIHESQDRVSYIQALSKVYVNLVTDSNPYRTLEKGDKVDVKDTDPSHSCYDFETWTACGTYLNYSMVNDCIFTAFGFTTLCTHVKWQSYITDWHWAMFILVCITIFGFFFRNTFGVCLKYCGPITCCAKTKVDVGSTSELGLLKLQLAELQNASTDTSYDSSVESPPPLKRQKITRYSKRPHPVHYSMLFFFVICISISPTASSASEACCVFHMDPPQTLRAFTKVYVTPPSSDTAVTLYPGDSMDVVEGILPVCFNYDTLEMCSLVYQHTNCYNIFLYSQILLILTVVAIVVFCVALRCYDGRRKLAKSPLYLQYSAPPNSPTTLEPLLEEPSTYAEIDDSNPPTPVTPARRPSTLSLSSYLSRNSMLIMLLFCVVDCQRTSVASDSPYCVKSSYIHAPIQFSGFFGTLAFFLAITSGFFLGCIIIMVFHSRRNRAVVPRDTEDEESVAVTSNSYGGFPDSKVESELSPRKYKSYGASNHSQFSTIHMFIMFFVFCCVLCISSGCRSNIVEIEKNGHRTTAFRYGYTTVVVPSDHASFLKGGKCGSHCTVTLKEALFYLYGYPLSSGLESVESSHVNLRIPEVLPPLPIECVTSDYKFFPANISQQQIIPTVVDIEPARYYFCYTCSSIFGTDLLGIFGSSKRAYGLDHAYEVADTKATSVKPGPMLARHNKYPSVYSAMTFFPPWLIKYTTNNQIFITEGTRHVKKRCVEIHDPTSPDGYLDPDTSLLYSCRRDIRDDSLNDSHNAHGCFAGVSTLHFIFTCYADRDPSNIIFNVGTCSYSPPINAQNPLSFCGCTCKQSRQPVKSGRSVFYTNCVCDHDLDFSSLRVIGNCYTDSNLTPGSQWFVNSAVSGTYQYNITKILPPTSGIYRYINGCTHPSGNLIVGDSNSTDFFVNLLPHLERYSSFPFSVVKQSSAPSDSIGYFDKCMYGNSSIYFGFQPCFTPNYHCLHSSDCPEFSDPVTYVSDTVDPASSVPCVCPHNATKFSEDIDGGFSGSVSNCSLYLGTYRSHDAISYHGRIVWINNHLNASKCNLRDVGSLASYEDISNWFLKYDCGVKQAISYPMPPFKDGCLPQANSKVIERYSELGNRRAISRWVCGGNEPFDIGPDCDSKYPIDSALLNSSRGLIYYARPSYQYGGHVCYYYDKEVCPQSSPYLDKSVAMKDNTVYITGHVVYYSDKFAQSFAGNLLWAMWPNGTNNVHGFCTALGHGVAIHCRGVHHFLHWYPDHLSPSVCNSSPKSDYTVNDHVFDYILPPSYTYSGCHNVDSTGCCMDNLLYKSLSVTPIQYKQAEIHDDKVLIYHQGAGVSHYLPKQHLPPGDIKYYYTPDGIMTTMFDMPVLNSDYTYHGPTCATPIAKSSPHFARINDTHVCVSFHEYSPPYNVSTKYKMEMLQDYYHPDFTLKNLEGMYPVLYTPDVPCSDYYASMVLSGYYEIGNNTFEVWYTPVWHIPPRCFNKPPMLTPINHSAEFGLSGIPIYYYSMPKVKSASSLKMELVNGTLYRFKGNSVVIPAFVDHHLVLGASESGQYVYTSALDHPVGDNAVEDFQSKCSSSPMHWHCIVVISVSSFLGCVLLCGLAALMCMRKHPTGYMPVPQDDIELSETNVSKNGNGQGRKKYRPRSKKKSYPSQQSMYSHPQPYHLHLLLLFCLITVVSCDWQGSIADCERTYPMGDKKDFPPYIKSPYPYTPIGDYGDRNYRLGSHPDMAYFMAESGYDFYLGSDNVGGRPLTDFKQPIQDSDFTSAFDADRIISGSFGCAGGVKCNCNYTFERSVLPTTPGTVVSSAIVCNNISWPYAMRIYSRPVEYNCVHYASTSPWTYSYCDRYDCDEDCPSYLINGYCGPKCYDGSYNVYKQPETIQVKHDTMSGISDGCGSVETGTQVVIVRNIADLRKVDHVGKCSLHSRSALVCLLVVDRVTCHMAKDFSFLNANVSFEITEESDPVPSFDYTIRTSDGKVYDSLFGDLGVSWNPPSWGHYTDFRISNFYKSDLGYYPPAINYDVAPTFNFDWDCSWTGAAYSPEGDSSHCHVTINGVATDSGYTNLYQDDLVHLGGIYRDTILLGYNISEVAADDEPNKISPVMSVVAAFVPNYGHGYFSFSNSFDVTAPPNIYADWVNQNNVVLQLHDCKLGLSVGGNTGCYITATIKAGAPTMPVSLHCKYPMYCDTSLAFGPHQSEYYVEVHAYASHAEIGDLKINVTVKGTVVSTLSTSDWSLRGTETRGLMSYGMSEVMPRRRSPGGQSDTAVSTEWTVAIVLGVVAFLLIGGFVLALYCFRKSKKKRQAAGDGGVGKCAVAGLVIVVLSFVAVLGVLAYFIATAISGVTGIISAPLDAVEGLVSDAIVPDANVSNWNQLNATDYACAVHYTATLTHFVSPLKEYVDVINCVRGCESNSCPGYVMDDVCRYMTNASEVSRVFRESYTCTKEPELIGKPAHSGASIFSPSFFFCVSVAIFTIMSNVRGAEAYDVDRDDDRGHSGRGRGFRHRSSSRRRERSPRHRTPSPYYREPQEYYRYRNSYSDDSTFGGGRGRGRSKSQHRPQYSSPRQYAPIPSLTIESRPALLPTPAAPPVPRYVNDEAINVEIAKLYQALNQTRLEAMGNRGPRNSGGPQRQSSLLQAQHSSGDDKRGRQPGSRNRSSSNNPSQGSSTPKSGPLAGYDFAISKKDVISACTMTVNGYETPIQVMIICKPVTGHLTSYTNRSRITKITTTPIKMMNENSLKARPYPMSFFDINSYPMYESAFPFLTKAEVKDLSRFAFSSSTLSKIIQDFSRTGNVDDMGKALTTLVTMGAVGEPEDVQRKLHASLSSYPYMAVFHRLVRQNFTGGALITFMMSLLKLNVQPILLEPRTSREKGFTRKLLGALPGAAPVVESNPEVVDDGTDSEEEAKSETKL